MLSDILFEAAAEMKTCLDQGFYDATIERRVRALIQEMDAIRTLPGLDTPPKAISFAKEYKTGSRFVTFFERGNYHKPVTHGANDAMVRQQLQHMASEVNATLGATFSIYPSGALSEQPIVQIEPSEGI